VRCGEAVKRRTFAQRKALLGNAAHAGRTWRLTLGFLFWAIVVITGVALYPRMPWRGPLIGFLFGVTVTFLLIGTMRVADPVVHGSWAEQLSLESLRKVDGWLVTENLPFSDVDVDHVVVTPAGVLAVETKYRGRAFNGSVGADRHRRDLDATLAAARKVTSFLRSRKLAGSTEVVPVLMVWGEATPDLPDGAREEHGVVVVDADNPQVWSHRFAAPRLASDDRQLIHREFTNYLAIRHGYEANKMPALRVEMWQAFRRGMMADRERRLALKQLKASLSRRHSR